MQVLLILMVIDYITGLIVAGVFKKSRKSDTGGLNSFIGWMGLAKKFTILLFIIIAVQLDLLLHMEYVRNAAITFFAVNETLSVIENAGLMGIPIPEEIKKAVDVLSRKEGAKNEL